MCTTPRCYSGSLDSCSLARDDAGNIIFEVEYHEDRSIKNLLIADAILIDYLNEHPDCLLGDNTYKTNKFGMPAFHVISIGGQNQAFTILLCFLEDSFELPIRKFALLIRPGVFPSFFAV